MSFCDKGEAVDENGRSLLLDMVMRGMVQAVRQRQPAGGEDGGGSASEGHKATCSAL